MCAQNSIDLEVQWVPRSLNTTADSLSKVFDYDDWGVSIAFFRFVDDIFGPHSLIGSRIVRIVNFRRFHPGSRRRVHPVLTRFPWIGLVITIGKYRP